MPSLARSKEIVTVLPTTEWSENIGSGKRLSFSASSTNLLPLYRGRKSSSLATGTLVHLPGERNFLVLMLEPESSAA